MLIKDVKEYFCTSFHAFSVVLHRIVRKIVCQKLGSAVSLLLRVMAKLFDEKKKVLKIDSVQFLHPFLIYEKKKS